MLEAGFARCNAHHCLYVQKFKIEDFLIHTLYVDDMLITRSSMKKINDLKNKLARRFSMKDVDNAKHFLRKKIT